MPAISENKLMCSVSFYFTFYFHAYHAAADITFRWGDLDPANFWQTLKEAYAEVVHWKKNLFKAPLGNVGKSFVAEVSRL